MALRLAAQVLDRNHQSISAALLSRAVAVYESEEVDLPTHTELALTMQMRATSPIALRASTSPPFRYQESMRRYLTILTTPRTSAAYDNRSNNLNISSMFPNRFDYQIPD
jgi:hypothetical protein